jgi:proteasome assembly chaperone (PAC2) family protein
MYPYELSSMYQRRYLEVSGDSLKSPVALVGLPGLANVGRIAIETLVQVLGAEHFMDFFSTDFQPRVFIRNGISTIPKSTVHIYRSAPDEPHDLLFLSADYQPSTSNGVYEYADFVAGEFSALGVREIYALAAYEQSYEEYFNSYPEPPRIYASASSEILLGKISALSNIIVTPEGAIVGANGVIPIWAATLYNMDGACLLGETLGVIKADYRAAKAVLEKIVDVLGINVDFDDMDLEISKVVQLIEWAKQEIAQKKEPSDDDSSPSNLYIG